MIANVKSFFKFFNALILRFRRKRLRSKVINSIIDSGTNSKITLLNSIKERRNKIREYIHEAGVQTSVHYPAAHKFSTYKELGAVLPQTEYVTDNEITLPMYAALTDEQIDFICDTYIKAIKEIQ